MSEMWNIEASTKGHFQISWSVFCFSPNAHIFFWLTKSYQNCKYCSSHKKLPKYEHENDWFGPWPNFEFYINFQLLERSHSQVPHTRPETPQSLTHNHDEDYSDEESDSKSSEEKAGWLCRLHCGGNRSTGFSDMSENLWPCTRGQGISLVLVAALLCD